MYVFIYQDIFIHEKNGLISLSLLFFWLRMYKIIQRFRLKALCL